MQISTNYDVPNFRLILCRANDFCGSPDAITQSFLPGTPFMARYRKNGTNISAISNGKLDTTTSIPGAFPANSILRLGARYDSLAQSFFRGDLGEILIFNNQLSGTVLPFGINDRDYIDCYLSAKYGIRLDPSSPVICP